MAEKKKLSYKRKMFIEKYIACNFNGAKAAEAAGYSPKGSNAVASRLLKIPEIKEAIEERIAEARLDADKVLYHLTQQAENIGTRYYRLDEDGNVIFDFKKCVEDGNAFLIKRVEQDSTGKVVKVEFIDAQTALIHMGKFHGLFRDRVEAAITPNILVDL